MSLQALHVDRAVIVGTKGDTTLYVVPVWLQITLQIHLGQIVGDAFPAGRMQFDVGERIHQSSRQSSRQLRLELPLSLQILT
jgi:hypothetical protein